MKWNRHVILFVVELMTSSLSNHASLSVAPPYLFVFEVVLESYPQVLGEEPLWHVSVDAAAVRVSVGRAVAEIQLGLDVGQLGLRRRVVALQTSNQLNMRK
jgi:hypothetical protein